MAEDLQKLPIQAFPAITEIRSPVQSELDRRKKSFGKNNLPSAVWTRLISNSRPKLSNTRRRNERKDVHVLMGGGTLEKGKLRGGLEDIYGYKRSGNINEQVHDSLLRPTPGIENISVTMEGELGSLRRARITWNAPSIFDLEELSPYFLQVGTTAILEWGWGIFQNGQVTAFGFTDNPTAEMLSFWDDPRKIYQRPIDARGLYDVMLGYVTNFEWSANTDGSFTCITELTSMGELMAGLHLTEQRNSTNPTEFNIAQTMKQYASENLADAVARFKKDDFDEKNNIDVIRSGENPDSDDQWVSWGFLEDRIINASMFISNQGKKEGSGGFFPLKIDSRDSFISNDSKLISITDDILINQTTGDLLKFADPNGDKFSGVLRNLYVKLSFIKKIINDSETFKDIFETLLNTANNAGSNIWDLELYVNPLTERLQVIDAKYTNKLADGLKPRRVFSLGGFGKETILKNVNLVSKLTQQIALTYMFAANRDDSEKDTVVNAKDDMGVATLYGGFDDLVVFKLKTRQEQGSTGVLSKDEKDAADNVLKEFYRKEAATNQALDVAINGAKRTFIPERDFKFKILDSKGKEALSRYLHRKTQNNKRRKQQLFAPLELNVTIDGIGGIIPGNIFRIENIPEVYERNGVFQVIRVEHEISPETWDTKIQAYFKIINFDSDTGDILDKTKKTENLKDATGDSKSGASSGTGAGEAGSGGAG